METRDNATDSRFIGLLMSDAGLTGEEASSVIRVVRNNDFLIKEIKSDPEPPERGSLKSLRKHEIEWRQHVQDLDEETHALVQEFSDAYHQLGPVFQAIQMAMEVKNGPSDPLPGSDA